MPVDDEVTPGKLAALTSDVSFKRAFGSDSSKETLKHLLNALMSESGKPLDVSVIENVEFKDAVLRSVVFDVRCQLTSGERVIIEVQKADIATDMTDRLIGYMSYDYMTQWRRGGKMEAPVKGKYKLLPVRMLALLDFCLDDDSANCGSLVQHYHMQLSQAATQVSAPAAAKRLRELSDITIVQLPLAPDKIVDGMSDAEKWAHLLHSSQQYSIATLPQPLRATPFLAAAESARLDKMTVEERKALHEQR